MSEIKVNKITKYYDKTCALKDISLTFESNKIHGLLGRNGAGKTTLLNLIANRLFPTEGNITIDGENVVENDNAISKIFYMTEKNLYPEGKNIKEIFKWTKEFYPSFNKDYAYELCEKFELKPEKKIRSLSTGYNTISKLIIAMASNAPVIILDEPILGLDAYHRDLFYKELLKNYIDSPKTIILSTHIIEEIADIVEKVVILKDRKIVVEDNVENFLNKAYSISGLSEDIDQYIEGKNCIRIDKMSSYKAATIMEKLSEKDRIKAEKLKLKISKVELQKLFIHLTGEGCGKE